MRKILLVVEDYNELIFLETLYKKLGLTVEGVQNDVAVPEKLLSFDPDMLIISTYGARVNIIKILGKVKRRGGYPKIVALFQKGRGLEKEIKGLPIDTVLESPMHPPVLLEVTERLLEMAPGSLTKKLERIDMAGGWAMRDDNEIQHIKSSPRAQFPLKNSNAPDTSLPPELKNFRASSELSDEKIKLKREKYKALAEREYLPPHQKIGRDRVASIEKSFRAKESDPEVVDIDKERLAFAKALFKK